MIQIMMQYMCNMNYELLVHVVFDNNFCKFRTLIETLIVSHAYTGGEEAKSINKMVNYKTYI